ncbi:hypothetical protein SEUCBS140593_008068 [Sporothrix eucalyptigena]|uniref:Uncharacterized protein n=1 Tax=Sporothrix eucalyptigena TaxID=1812306 RepID=A0ABP0CID4_9PEZI
MAATPLCVSLKARLDKCITTADFKDNVIGGLYAAVTSTLVNFVDLEQDEACPLLIASLGESAHNFQAFMQVKASTDKILLRLQMANNAVVVDTYGVSKQADSDPSSSSKPKSKMAKNKNKSSESDSDSTGSQSCNSDPKAAFNANI